MAEELQISDFEYVLPEELIAQEPCVRREDARLLVVDRATQTLSHHHIYDLPQLLKPDDLLIFNNTKVLPARIYGIRSSTGGKWEGLYLRERLDLTPPCWELMAHSRGYLQDGEWVDLLDRQNAATPFRLQVVGRTPERYLLVTLLPAMKPAELFEQIGHVPLPPYIRKGLDTAADLQRYQTVYAETPGSVAAPTAGLHFTKELLTQLTKQGVNQAHVTLHVGIGTFAPVKVDHLNDHVMHEEWCELSAETAKAVNTCRGRRIAVGTTSARTLESAPLTPNPTPRGGEGDQRHISLPVRGNLQPFSGTTSLFIRPGYQFQTIDGLLTNFHLPRSTLLVLISALAGRDLIRAAYAEAIRERYRFFSYGDAMLIL